MSFPQIERLLQLDELLRSKQKHTQQSLAEALEVSDRTIRTYLDFMREALRHRLNTKLKIKGKIAKF